ncbi:MAG: dihydrolipoyl dehydrogenase [Deltaproteobacteria bacterium]|nr:dihydrolipoyl dehydrogenase [Deltaproteobacteria bacterium]
MQEYDLAVIGAGPGGYVAAIRGAQLGLRVALIEKRDTLGGTCLNVGCIPSKALLETSELFATLRHKLGDHGIAAGAPAIDIAAMLRRKERIVKEVTEGVAFLMKKNKVAVITGSASFAGAAADGSTGAGRVLFVTADGGRTELAAKHVVIATGSAPVELPFLRFDGRCVISSTEALALPAVPRHLVVIGAGAVGLELGSVWLRLGAQVTVVEMLPQIAPFADTQLARALERSLRQQGMAIRLKTKVTAAQPGDDAVGLTVESDGRSEALVCDKVLVAVGRRAYTDGLGLEAIGLALEAGGKIAVDGQFCTSVAGVYAIGDVIAGPMLAHKAEEEGIALAELIAGQPGHVNYDALPSVVYTDPELAGVGLTEEQARERRLEVKVGRFYFKANARAKTMGHDDGLVKVIADAGTDRLLGVHIVGPRASDLIAEAVVAIELKASAGDLGRAVHAHPTLSEACKEAALASARRSIHGA